MPFMSIDYDGGKLVVPGLVTGMVLMVVMLVMVMLVLVKSEPVQCEAR